MAICRDATELAGNNNEVETTQYEPQKGRLS
jgi:hypothetical protein